MGIHATAHRHRRADPLLDAALARLAPIIRSSHERWDGAGYPDGLAGEAIPLLSRIVCDAFDAMTCNDRAYRQALSRAEALLEFRRCAGTQFDERVVQALASVLRARTRKPRGISRAA
jgi:HD-GYP domain-containing protein (c-di-GMP phosphodiesterase class II)